MFNNLSACVWYFITKTVSRTARKHGKSANNQRGVQNCNHIYVTLNLHCWIWQVVEFCYISSWYVLGTHCLLASHHLKHRAWKTRTQRSRKMNITSQCHGCHHQQSAWLNGCSRLIQHNDQPWNKCFMMNFSLQVQYWSSVCSH